MGNYAIFHARLMTGLESLPLGFGSNLVVPLLQWGRHPFLRLREKVHRYRIKAENTRAIAARKALANHEAARINSAIEAGIKKAIIVYDNSVSPPTYGDFLQTVILARYLQARDIFIEFYLLDSEYRKDWGEHHVDAEGLIDEFERLANSLLNTTSASVKRLSWKTLNDNYDPEPSTNIIIPFEARVRDRIAIYNDCFNLVNVLLSGLEPALLKKILFTGEELKPFAGTNPLQKPYVTWHCRFSQKWCFDRNISDEWFLQIHSLLKDKFNGFDIMVISDDAGCNYFKALADRQGLDILFCKDYSRSFIGDAYLILASEFYLQFRGGGIGVFPLFSEMSYRFVVRPIHETPWSKTKFTSWQTTEQTFIDSDKLSDCLTWK